MNKSPPDCAATPAWATSRRTRHGICTLFLLGLIILPARADELRPWEEQAVSVETGLLWQWGHDTQLSYRLIPTQFSWRSRESFGWQFLSGHLTVRDRITLLGTWIQQGPESHYVALDASPSIEWWNKRGNWCVYGGSGGGFGWLNSQGVRGSQGQDFTFNWFARGGIEHIGARGIRWSAGVMFQHMSNGGQTSPNPGINALGATVGWAWSF
jgi:lipid A 3-O-deacylase